MEDKLREIEETLNKAEEMVIKLADTSNNTLAALDKVTVEYSKHLGRLSVCRDELLRQNTMLIEILHAHVGQPHATNVNVN